MHLKIVVASIFLVVFRIAHAQKKEFNIIYPIDRTAVITGNYGELRPNHFHAGLDFSTDPNLNLPIKSIADGYVSRIKISCVGYGKVLYVTHANGYVSVYAHQKKYSDKIDQYIKQKQIESHQNEIEVFPTKNELPVKQAEIIGYTGNSGGSSGPHLHFEIRDEKSEVPINPLLIYKLKDEVKPTVTHLAIYNTSDTNEINLQQVLPLPTKNKTLLLKQNTFALGFAGYDVTNANGNKNNIYEAKLLLDGKLIYHHQLNNISFDNGRFVNYFSEKNAGIKIQKCFTPTCYDVGIYQRALYGGKIMLTDTLQHQVILQCFDEAGNKTEQKFDVVTKKVTNYKIATKKNNVDCNKDFELKFSDVEVFAKANTFINSASITLIKNKGNDNAIVGNSELLIRPYQLSVKKENPIKGKEDKLVLILNDNCLLGKYEKGWFKTDSKYFGAYKFSYDTIAPKLSYLTVKSKKKNINAVKKQYSFKVSDNLSGIANYNVYVNTIWTIAEYDAKSATITCYLSDAQQKETHLKVKLEVFDKVGNVARLEL